MGFNLKKISFFWKALALLALLIGGGIYAPASFAASCGPATSQGTAPSDYQSYCWLDFSSYNDTAAKSASGQNFTFNLSDGSTLRFTMKVTNSASGTAIVASSSPSWTGAAFGNSAFLGIPNKPVLYQNSNGTTTTVKLSGINITPPAGTVGGATIYSIIMADGESTNNGESLSFTTNGSPWKTLASVANGGNFPALSGVNTNTVTETGAAGQQGSFVFGSFNNPTQISATMVGSGLQGIDIAIRFASVSVTTVISGNRVNPADQFTYSINTTSGTSISTKTSTGTGLGPFPIASSPTIAASYPFVVQEVMASGSVSSINNYDPSLTCTNTSTVTPATPIPNNLKSTSYTFPTIQYGDTIACVFTNNPYPNITGVVYLDANRNNQIDPGELGTGVTPLYVKLTHSSGGVCQSPAISVTSPDPTSGIYTFPGVAQGNYCLILSNNNTLTDISPSHPVGYLGTEASSGIRQFYIGPSASPAQNFGLYKGIIFSGTVFADTGVGSGIANNGLKDGTETGIANVVVNASVSGSVLTSTTTDASGSYTLILPSSTTGTIVITPVNPNGYVATGGSAGTSGGTYARPSVSVTASPTLSGIHVDFGLIPPNTFAPDGIQSASPGTVVFYAHTFVAQTAGNVTFTTSAASSPTLIGWTETLYLDSNCNGHLDTGEAQITSAIDVTAGQNVCVLVKEFVPLSAPLNAQNVVTFQTTFSYTNSNPALTNSILIHTDTTTVSVSGTIQLSKQVSNITQGTPFATSTHANPGDTLKYQLVITNPSSQSINQLVVNDATPSFTQFISAACPLASSLPSGLTACAVTIAPSVGGQGAVRWTFTGSLAPSDTVTVTYQVTVSQ